MRAAAQRSGLRLPMLQTLTRLVMVAGLSAMIAGCGGGVQFPRYYQPPSAKLSPRPPPAINPAVRLSTVQSAPHVGRAMTWRLSEVELAFDDLHRWATPPAALTQRRLEELLFIERNFAQAEGAQGTLLMVEVEAFEAVERTREAQVALLVTAQTPGGQTFLERFSARHPAKSASASDIALASGIALQEVLNQVANWIERHAQSFNDGDPSARKKAATGSAAKGSKAPSSRGRSRSTPSTSSAQAAEELLLHSEHAAPGEAGTEPPPPRRRGRYVPAN